MFGLILISTICFPYLGKLIHTTDDTLEKAVWSLFFPVREDPLSGWLSRACLGKTSLFSASSQIAAWNKNSKPKVHHMILFWTLYVYVYVYETRSDCIKRSLVVMISVTCMLSTNC
eukprot:COSAG06_NODE_1270_length_10057_cov_9.373167_1_plen_116_part_00